MTDIKYSNNVKYIYNYFCATMKMDCEKYFNGVFSSISPILITKETKNDGIIGIKKSLCSIL